MTAKVGRSRLRPTSELPIKITSSESLGILKSPKGDCGDPPRKARTAPVKESVIEAHIRQYLSLKGVFWFKIKTVGTYDPKIKRFRSTGAHYMKGVSDILGIYNGRFLAIEVKSGSGRLRTEQALFLQRVRENGGIAFVARSVEEVASCLEQWRSFTKEPA